MALRATGLFPAWFVVAREFRPGHERDERPAGTREALPGTLLRKNVPRFLHESNAIRLVQKSMARRTLEFVPRGA